MAQGLGTSTEKQVRLALNFLERNGYSTRRIEAKHGELAPIEGFVNKSVERWLHSMSKEDISKVIDKLGESTW